MSIGSRAKRYLKARGAWATAGQIVRYFWRKAFVRESPIVIRRRSLGLSLHRKFNGIVQAGPLAGFKLGSDPTWGAADRGPMLLGFYEAPVTKQLEEFSLQASTLVDIGAADGYFGVGFVASGLYSRSVCFESDLITTAAMREVAHINNVTDLVTVFGAADATFASKLQEAKVDLEDTVILCDIEGGEFSLFDDKLLGYLSRCKIIIELHEKMFSNGDAQLACLLESANHHFEIRFLDSGSRNPSEVGALQGMPEDDRWLLCSEGRNIFQRWMVLEPRPL